MEFPSNVFQWTKAFNDDFGFEAWKESRPTDELPGSPGKIGVIIERLSRGQKLWCEGDGVIDRSEYEYNTESFKVKGNDKAGAVVGSDKCGDRHRYGLWKTMETMGPKMLYIPAYTGCVDLFDRDEELRAIERHARGSNASLLIVASLFSVRVKNSQDFRNKPHPLTSLGMMWMRWFAKYVDMAVICWGDNNTLGRSDDVLWMLSRTRRFCSIYATKEAGPPPPIHPVFREPLVKYDYKSAVEQRQKEEDEHDAGS